MKFDLSSFGAFGEAMARRHEPEGIRVVSNVYWRTLIVVELLVIVLVLGYGIWGLLRVLNALGEISSTSARPQSALDRTKLEATVSGFEDRQAQFDSLKTNRGAPIADPSR